MLIGFDYELDLVLLAPEFIGLVKKRKKGGLGRFIIGTLFLLAAAMAGLVYGPVLLKYISFSTPNYRAFGVPVPGGYSIIGIDVSRYQGRIDWEKVKKMRSGPSRIHFVFAKSTEGLAYKDPSFDRNRKQCGKHGLPFGAYHYFIPSADPVRQADFFASEYQPRKGDLPPVADIEITGNLGRHALRKSVRIFLERLQAKTGVRPILYSGHSFYQDYLADGFEQYTFWLAHYGPGKPHNQPWTIWQFSEQATVSGINHRVDLNVFRGDSAAFEKLRIR